MTILIAPGDSHGPNLLTGLIIRIAKPRQVCHHSAGHGFPITSLSKKQHSSFAFNFTAYFRHCNSQHWCVLSGSKICFCARTGFGAGRGGASGSSHVLFTQVSLLNPWLSGREQKALDSRSIPTFEKVWIRPAIHFLLCEFTPNVIQKFLF